MKHYGSLLLLFTLALSAGFVRPQMQAYGGNPVQVTVYYQALCSDAARFITTQLYPVWFDLKGIINLDLNAHGKSTFILDRSGCRFNCQGGPKECEGNFMLTCARCYIPDMERFVDFVNCVMIRFRGAAGLDQCAIEAKLNRVEKGHIENCYQTPEGLDLQYQVAMKQYQLRPLLNYVPWILINGVVSRAAESNLGRAICQAYRGYLPRECVKYM